MNWKTINVAFEVLTSDVIRNGDEGFAEREIDTTVDFGDDDGNVVVDAILGVVRFFGKAIGFVWSLIQPFLPKISWSGIIGALVEAAFTIYYFDWGQSDDQLRANIEANKNQIATLRGLVEGSTAARVLVGSVLGLGEASLVVLPMLTGKGWVALGSQVLADQNLMPATREFISESTSEVAGQVLNFIGTAARVQTENAFIQSVLWMRKMRWFGMQPEHESGAYDSFAERISQQTEAIEDPRERARRRGFVEGFEDGLFDSLFILGSTLDNNYPLFASRKLSAVNGIDRKVEITPDIRVPGEAMIIRAPQALMPLQIDNVLANHRLVANRDMGQIVGMPAEDLQRGRYQERQLTIVMKSKPRPPYTGARSMTINIPDAVSGLSFQRIKSAIGQNHLWGKYRATANLSNHRQMAIYGASPENGKTLIERLMQLSLAQIETMSVTEEVLQDPRRRKITTVMYPAYATITTTPLDQQGKPSGGDGEYKRRRRRLALWPEFETDDLGGLD